MANACPANILKCFLFLLELQQGKKKHYVLCFAIRTQMQTFHKISIYLADKRNGCVVFTNKAKQQERCQPKHSAVKIQEPCIFQRHACSLLHTWWNSLHELFLDFSGLYIIWVVQRTGAIFTCHFVLFRTYLGQVFGSGLNAKWDACIPYHSTQAPVPTLILIQLPANVYHEKHECTMCTMNGSVVRFLRFVYDTQMEFQLLAFT